MKTKHLFHKKLYKVMVNLFHILLIWVKQIHVFCHPYIIRLLSSSRCKKKIGFQNTFNKTDVIQYLRNIFSM